MPEFHEDLLISPINKKRIIGIFIICILLISIFAFSVLLYSFIFESQRPFPSDQLSEAEWEEGIPVFIPLPFNWSDIFSNLNLTQDQLQDLLDSLQDMFDGDIDYLDLDDFAQTILALMFSEIEVFRVYYYSDFNMMRDKLWKYECFDEYTGDSWHSTASTQDYNFYSFDNYFNHHSDKDLLNIKIPLTPTIGINSMVVPNLFPNPYILDGSVSAPNLVLSEPDDPQLFKDDFNSTTMDLTFTSETDVNMSYNMFGLNLPSDDEINSTAIQAIYTPSILKNRYLQLPPSISSYINNNPNFNNDYLILNQTLNENDNAFVVANKIRNYLQNYFTFPLDPNEYNPAPPGRDTVDWFCETRMGVWSDFASAFCVFCRAFGVACRFVDGFNSFGIEETYDPVENVNTFAIKYRNLYNWAEIYVPSDPSGNGQWVQMDILFSSFGGGSNPLTLENYSISVFADQLVYNRPSDLANITAILSSDNGTIDNKMITFRDVSSGEILGNDLTDLSGQASILVNIYNTTIVGPHSIEARLNPLIANYTLFFIPGDIGVELSSVNPTVVNSSDITNVKGYLYDPLNQKRVRGGEINFILLQYGTNNHISNAFIPPSQYTDSNGEFDEFLSIHPDVLSGQYEIRIDFNNTWFGISTYIPINVTNSSQRVGFNITRGSLFFYINSYPSYDANNPVVYRNDLLNLTATVMIENAIPVQGKTVYFYHDIGGGSPILLGSEITNVNGIASISLAADSSFTAGPNLLYAEMNMQTNYSYFILNEPPIINIYSGPTPREINRTIAGATNTFFNIQGEIRDITNGNPLHDFILSLRLLRGGLDYSYYLIPSEYFISMFDGSFNINFQVASNTPTGNYTLRLDFNGTIDYTWHPIYPYFFNLHRVPFQLNTSTPFSQELLVSTPATLIFKFWINGTSSYDYNQPIINYNDHLDLSVNLTWGDVPIEDGELIEFFDVTQNILIDTVSTSSGFAQTIYVTDNSTIAGPHQIYAKWGSNYNYSYFIIDEQIVVDFENGPLPRQISRGQTSFNLHGYINDSLNHFPIKYAEISVHLYDGPTEIFGYLVQESGSLQLDNTGEFDIYYSVSGSTPEQNYTIKIEFNGIFLYSNPPSNNPYDFYLFLPNFYDIANASHDLKVVDPANLTINLSVEGNPALPFYDNVDKPETYTFGSIAYIQVTIVHVEDIFDREVRIYDDYDDTLLNSSIFTIHAFTGLVQFNIPTNNFHAGLNRLRVEYHTFATFNTTYVVVNETFTISPSPSTNALLRDIDNFYVNTYVQDGSINLNGLEITLMLLDSDYNNVSYYLNMVGPKTITIYNGYFQFNINSISLNCPEGQYYVVVAFHGNLFDVRINLIDYMIHVNSSFIPINVIAGTVIIEGSYYTDYDFIYPEYSDQWIINDTLHINGTLTWDNGTAMQNMFINVSVININFGGILIAYNDTVQTDNFGNFHVTIFVDQNDPWPQYRSESEIWVYFDPVINGLQYVQESENNYMS